MQQAQHGRWQPHEFSLSRCLDQKRRAFIFLTLEPDIQRCAHGKAIVAAPRFTVPAIRPLASRSLAASYSPHGLLISDPAPRSVMIQGFTHPHVDLTS